MKLITGVMALILAVLFLSSYSTARLYAGGSYAAQPYNETLLSETENAYNPIPSPDGKLIAFVRTGRWEQGSGGQGRSNLRSEIMVMDAGGHVITDRPLAEAFLAGWTADGTRLVCYRDYSYFLVSLDGKKSKQVDIPFDMSPASHNKSERGAYLPASDAMIFVEYLNSSLESKGKPVIGVIRTADKEIARPNTWLGCMLVPSPDGRYVAAIDDQFVDSHLFVYDTQQKSWADLGQILVHPAITHAGFGNNDWEWMQATWDPWFHDSSRLAFIAHGSVVVSGPDGKNRQTITRVGDRVGLATPSPDGHSIAYVTSDARIHPEQPHWTFWGDTTIWVVAAEPGARARPVTQRNADATYCLRWLNSSEIVFDRFDDNYHFSSHHRLWKAVAGN